MSDQPIDLDLPWCFTDEHRAWRKSLREFCEREIAPTAAQRNIEARFDAGLMSSLGDLGVYGLLTGRSSGEMAGDMRSFCLTIEELARVDSGVAVTVHVQAIAATLFEHLASAEQRRELLPGMASGSTFISFGLTEPTGGSDAGNIGTTAEPRDGGWVINGAKQFITNSGTPFSRSIILFAATPGPRAPGSGPAQPAGTPRTPGRRGRPPVSAFLVPLDAPGVTVGPSYPKLGWRTSDTHPLYFDDVEVPDSALLGEEGRGYGEALRFLTWARLPIASMSVGLAQGCLEETLAFVGSRTSFNQPLGSLQGVAFQVADIAAKTATARTLAYDAAWRYDHGHPYDQEAAICKLMASELANQVAYTATQLHGGYGFMDDSAVTRHYADARILTIGEGTSEIQRLLIARSLGLPV
ncbi:MAG TPA: acyl-CoA dehydrogenase family protein [Acidimicrobiia bacterium]